MVGGMKTHIKCDNSRLINLLEHTHILVNDCGVCLLDMIDDIHIS